jgi:hypothetical protein
MRIDPIIVLIHELNAAYGALALARDKRDWAQTRRELAAIAGLHARLRETEPSTVIGAAHQLREAAALLPQSGKAWPVDRLRAIAARFDNGDRRISDLIWLRRTLQALVDGAYGRPGESAACPIALALKGAARPVLLYRSVSLPALEHSVSARRETLG